LERILLIDDDPSICSSINYALTPPYTVDWAQDLSEARVLLDNHPSLIILDYRISNHPTIPGFLIELRKQLRFTPIIILTAIVDYQIVVEAFRAGCDDFLLKPYSIEDLRSRVKAFLNPRRHNRPLLEPRLVDQFSEEYTATREHPVLLRAIQCWAQAPLRLTITELAREVGVSPRHLIRLFKQFMGAAPRAFFTKLAIRQACSLLRYSDAAITDIAELLHFSDPAHFSRVFRKHTKLTPTVYRARARAGLQVSSALGDSPLTERQ
jgi:AraC-like DNA-binding protein